MPDLLIKNIEQKVLNGLKARAKRNNRSLQNEIVIILTEAANYTPSKDTEIARHIKDSLRGRNYSDSAELLREERAKG